jgi:hypothetical protein
VDDNNWEIQRKVSQVINVMELLLLLGYSLYSFCQRKDQIKTIRLGEESLITAASWNLFNTLSIIAHFQRDENSMENEQTVLQNCNLAFIIMRNMSSVLVPYYFSIFKINRQVTSTDSQIGSML